MSDTEKVNALARVRATQMLLNAAEEEAHAAAGKRDKAVADAKQYATHAELQAASGLSPARIVQILRRAKP